MRNSTVSVIAHVYQRPSCMDNDTPAGDHDPAPTRSCRPRQKTTSNGNGPARSHPTNLPTSSPRFKSGKQAHGAFQNHERDIWTSSRGDQSREDLTAWNTVDDQTVETPRTLHVVRAMRGILRHPVPGISDVDPMGRSEDIRLALRRREQREMKDKKSNVANLLELLWVRGKALPRGNRGTPWKKAPNDCDHPPTAIQKGGNAAMYSERCEMCGNRWQRIPLTMVARDQETKLGNRTVLASTFEATCRDRTPLLSTRTREHDDAGHDTAEPRLGMLDVQYHLRSQPGRVRCSTCGPGELRGCRREHGSHWGRRDTVPPKVQ